MARWRARALVAAGATGLAALAAACLLVAGRGAAPAELLLRPEQAPGFAVAPAHTDKLALGGAEYAPVHAGASQAAWAAAHPRASAAKRRALDPYTVKQPLLADPYSARPAEADYVDNAAAGISSGGRREVRKQRLRTQKLVEAETSGELGKQFDDVYAQKHWFENADANGDAAPELDIPKLKAEPADAVPTTPKLSTMQQDAAAKVLDREAGLAHPVVSRVSGGMKEAIQMAAQHKAAGAEQAPSGTSADADVAEGLRLLKADPADPVDRAAGGDAPAPAVPAKAQRNKLSQEDLELLQDARQRQAQDNGLPTSDFPSVGAMKTAAAGGKTPQLAVTGAMAPEEPQPKAADNPIGIASAAKVLKDAELFDESKNGDAMDKWKDAAKGAGPAILDAIKDDVSTYSPFPKTSLSERMEVQDVWDRARANTKPAGKLDGDAGETKDTVENAEAQAESQAYLAANEAAAVDAYDVSFPNPDMMAKGGAKKMSAQALANKRTHAIALQGQELAARPHKPHMLRGQEQAVGASRHRAARAAQALARGAQGHALMGQAQARGGHKMLQSRVQALAQVEQFEGEGAASQQKSAVRVALQDARDAKQTVEQLQAKVAMAKGEAKEAAKLRGFGSKAAQAARAKVTKLQLQILREAGAAEEARKLASELAGSSVMQSGAPRHEATKWAARRHAQKQAEAAASADRSRRALIMRLEDKAARVRTELDMAEMQRANARKRDRGRGVGNLKQETRSSVRRMVDTDGGSVGGLGSAFGDHKVLKGQNLLQQQLEGEDDGDEDDLFDRTRSFDERVKANNNQLSDIINGALGDGTALHCALHCGAAPSCFRLCLAPSCFCFCAHSSCICARACQHACVRVRALTKSPPRVLGC